MTLDYNRIDARSPEQPTTVDHVYTSLLAVLIVFQVLCVLMIQWLRTITVSPHAAEALRLPVIVYGVFLVPMAVVVLVRIVTPHRRRWPTFALNLVLLLLFPLGTSLAAFGLFRVDKGLRHKGSTPTSEVQR